MPDRPHPVKKVLTRELALFFSLLLTGIVLLPILIFVVGRQVFGGYGGSGFGAFFGDLSSRLRGGEFYAWFLVLSPYLAWQTLRLVRIGWRLAAPSQRRGTPARPKT